MGFDVEGIEFEMTGSSVCFMPACENLIEPGDFVIFLRNGDNDFAWCSWECLEKFIEEEK